MLPCLQPGLDNEYTSGIEGVEGLRYNTRPRTQKNVVLSIIVDHLLPYCKLLLIPALGCSRLGEDISTREALGSRARKSRFALISWNADVPTPTDTCVISVWAVFSSPLSLFGPSTMERLLSVTGTCLLVKWWEHFEHVYYHPWGSASPLHDAKKRRKPTGYRWSGTG